MTDLASSETLALKRARAVLDIIETINSGKPTEAIVLRINDILLPLIPFDRFTFGLQVWDQCYRVEDGRVKGASGTQIFGRPYPLEDAEISASLWAIAHRQSLLRGDISKEMRFEHDGRRVAEGMLSDLIVPILVDGKTVGTFNFTSRAPDVYSDDHLETAEAVASGIATVARVFDTLLSRSSLEEQVASRTAELEEANRQLKEEIAQRIHVEEELRDNAQLLRSTMEATEDGILVVGADDQVVLCNERFKELWQMPNHLFGSDSDKMLTFAKPQLKDPEAFAKRLEEIYSTDQEFVDTLHFKDGRVFERLSWPLLREGEVAGRVWSFRDVSKREQTQQEFVRLERLRALGELSAGVSHNLNNILTGILGPTQILEEVVEDEAIRRHLDIVSRASRRARDLVQRLHLYVRGLKDEVVSPVDVNHIVEEAFLTTRPRWRDEPEARGDEVRVVKRLSSLPAVMATVGGLHDTLVNLIMNAVDAMPKGGTITVRTMEAAGGVQLTFEDTGVGMDEETSARVFEPFFTTKRDVGSGLGLSTVYGTITGFDGRITVESTPGRGTTFTIWLPSTKESIEKGAAGGDRLDTRPGRVLIVDDDSEVRAAVRSLLRGRHEVDTVADGNSAVSSVQQKSYDAVLIDLGLPGRPGNAIVGEIKAIDPDVATVLITGWNLSNDDARIGLFDFHLAKPFSDLDDVYNTVARALQLTDSRRN